MFSGLTPKREGTGLTYKIGYVVFPSPWECKTGVCVRKCSAPLSNYNSQDPLGAAMTGRRELCKVCSPDRPWKIRVGLCFEQKDFAHSLPCRVKYSTISHTTAGIPFLTSPCCWSSWRLTPNTFRQDVPLGLPRGAAAILFISSFSRTADLLCLKEQRKREQSVIVTMGGCMVLARRKVSARLVWRGRLLQA